ncbi:unnamed protein product, partial [Owenia fusiformis]
VLIEILYFVYNYTTRKGVQYISPNIWRNGRDGLSDNWRTHNMHPFLNQMMLSTLTHGYWRPIDVPEGKRNVVITNLNQLRTRKIVNYSNTSKCGHACLGYRSICDPKDKKACCKENTCQDIPMSDCVCPTCFDERPRIFPEFHEWTPYDINMRNNVQGDHICAGLRLLNVSSMVTLGDSLIRQVTDRFWRRVYKGPVTHLLYNDSTK